MDQQIGGIVKEKLAQLKLELLAEEAATDDARYGTAAHFIDLALEVLK